MSHTNIVKTITILDEVANKAKELEEQLKRIYQLQKLISEGPEAVIPDEVLEWLKSIGATKLKSPMVYQAFVADEHMLYSINHLSNTPLDEIKKSHQRFIEVSERIEQKFATGESKKLQDMLQDV